MLIGTEPDQLPVNADLGNLAYQNKDDYRLERGIVAGQVRRYSPLTKTTNFAVGVFENWLICNGTATITVTLPSASENEGREIMIKTIAAFTVVSATANVQPINTSTPGAAILPATAGAWATLVSNGTDWVVMSRGT